MYNWKEERRQEQYAKVTNDAYIDGHGVYRWKSNDRVLFNDTLEEAGIMVPVAQTLAREEQNAKLLAEYVTAQSERSEEQITEERFEARAAMGPGVEMVNVFTGERYTT